MAKKDSDQTTPQFFSKKFILSSLLGLYILFSIAYIGLDFYNDFKQNYIDASYNQGRRATVEQVITQAEQSQCQPFSVFLDEKKVQLYNAACLQKTTPTQTKE
jgi:hypothetical protein